MNQIGRILPSDRPRDRWKVTPEIRAFHEKYIASHQRHDIEGHPLEILGVIRQRYANRSGMNVLEVGPAASVGVAESLPGRDNRYLGLDLSEPFLRKQREYLHDDGYIAGAHQVLADGYRLPIRPEAIDLAVVSCNPALVSASPADKMAILDEIAATLKPGGEFVLFPWYFKEQPSEVTRHLLSRFEVLDNLSPSYEDARRCLVLRRR